jgi:hypothetical protein
MLVFSHLSSACSIYNKIHSFFHKKNTLIVSDSDISKNNYNNPA